MTFKGLFRAFLIQIAFVALTVAVDLARGLPLTRDYYAFSVACVAVLALARTFHKRSPEASKD